MGRILTDLGEEYSIKNGLDSTTTAWSVGLYLDSTDSIVDTDDLAAITTEPSNTNYARQTSQFSPSDESGDWGSINDSKLSYDFSDQTTSQNIDSWFLVISFQATDTGDTSSNPHLVATGALSQTRDIGSIDTLNISAGGVGVTLT